MFGSFKTSFVESRSRDPATSPPRFPRGAPRFGFVVLRCITVSFQWGMQPVVGVVGGLSFEVLPKPLAKAWAFTDKKPPDVKVWLDELLGSNDPMTGLKLLKCKNGPRGFPLPGFESVFPCKLLPCQRMLPGHHLDINFLVKVAH